MPKDSIIIIEGVRTPLGSFQGNLSRLSAVELGTVATRSLLALTNVDTKEIDEVIMGCVLPAGLGQAPARQVALKSGLPEGVAATTVNKVCGSGMRAMIIGMSQLMAGHSKLLLTGGMESMSNAPLLKRRPAKGEQPVAEHYADHLFLDGLEDAYSKGTLMGMFAEATSKHYGFTRAEQDAYATESVRRAKQATAEKWFEREIASVVIKTPTETVEVTEDGTLDRAKIEKIPLLKPAFGENGTITAASSSGISDGAAVLMISTESHAKALGLAARAKIVGFSHHAHESKWFATAPIHAIQKLLEKTGWSKDSVDAFEINEAFAVVAMVAIKDLKLDPAKVNIHGGACALGHPIGASGARIVVTLLNVLERTGGKRGIAAICIGGGEALAVAIEV
ncbi:MAG: thiolase family protein [Alphaproteobacteria bacterium]